MSQQQFEFARLPPIIGIAGAARSGKDTLASMLLGLYGGYRYGFADPIREMLKPLGVNLSDPFWIDRKEELIPALQRSPRYLMQTLGTEWGRQLVHPNLWVYLAHQRLLNRGPGMIVSDVRFDNEADWIRGRNGVVIHLYRSNRPSVEAHVSESGVALTNGDFQLYNDGSLEDLRTAVRSLFDGNHQT